MDSNSVDGKLVFDQSDAPGTVTKIATSTSDDTKDVLHDRSKPGKTDQVTISHSADIEVAWLKKGKKTYYGYKVHMASDAQYGLVVGGHVTPANRSDMNDIDRLFSEIPEEICHEKCFADKGYTNFARYAAVSLWARCFPWAAYNKKSVRLLTLASRKSYCRLTI